MSVLAVEEYEELHVNFELEKNLRKKAESFAQEVSNQEKGTSFNLFWSAKAQQAH